MNTIKISRLLMLIFLSMTLSSAYAEEKKNVLILNSYHNGYKWTEDETDGAIAGLYPESENTRIYIEYMGAKWAFHRSYIEQLSKLYQQKFKNKVFDVIIATDDDALNFLKLYRDETFGKVPVVFCGINWITPERLQGLKSFAGVNEDAAIALNIDLMLKLHPATKDIYVIMDSTTTGMVIYNKLNEIIPQYINRVQIHLLFDMEMSSMLKQLSALDAGSLVLLTLYQKDKTGRFFEYSESCGLITKNSRVPVYGVWGFNLGLGIVGGNLVSGYSQGLTAGKLALRILKGESAESIPVVMNSPNLYMFDYAQMQRFDISTADIPAESLIINQPSSFYSINKQLFRSILAVILILAAAAVILILNIRRRYLAEKELRESEEKYHTLVDNLNVGVFRSTGDPDGKFIQVNPAMIKIFGYDSYDAFIKLPVENLYQDSAYRKNFINDIIAGGSVKDRELPMKKIDGTLIWASVSASAQYHASDKSVEWIDGILEDITQKKRIEMELRHAQKMETIGTLVSGIAHDFNNAIGGLVGMLSIIDNKLQSGTILSIDKLQYYTSIMKESGDKSIAMAQRLLTLARRRNAELIPSDLNDIVRRVVELLSGTIDKSISVFPVYNDERAVIMADPAQIEQSLLNLCINSWHAMTIMREDRNLWGGSLALSIMKIYAEKYFFELHPEAVKKEYWAISISDTGVGMTRDIVLKIFDPFFTTKGEGVGTGLGLAMVNQIIREHEGFIDVYSEPGTGTTFKVYIPVSYEKPDTSAVPKSVEIQSGTGLILVVDDEPVMRKTAREILEECGYDVITAEDGKAGVAIFRERYNEITAVVMDMAMPVMSGIIAYREMLKINPGVKVLIASGLRLDKRLQEVIAMGANGFIEKPYTLVKLGQAVKDIIEKDFFRATYTLEK